MSFVKFETQPNSSKILNIILYMTSEQTVKKADGKKIKMSVFYEEVEILQNHFGVDDGRMRENKEKEDICFKNKFSDKNEEQSSVHCDDYKYVVYLNFQEFFPEQLTVKAHQALFGEGIKEQKQRGANIPVVVVEGFSISSAQSSSAQALSRQGRLEHK